jgi:uncharacterized protein (TIGR03435 family)
MRRTGNVVVGLMKVLVSVSVGVFALLGSFVATSATAQSDKTAAFDVASVKQHLIPSGFIRRPWSPNIDCGPIAQCGVFGNRFTDSLASLTDLMMDAYSVRRYQISGLPVWGDSGLDVYDVDARVEEGRTLTLDQARRMLQTLLADRFQLKIHHETRELSVYALVVGKTLMKLKPTKETCSVPPLPAPNGGRGSGNRGGGGAGGPAIGPQPPGLMQSWAVMTSMLSVPSGRPIIDKTGLTEFAYCTLEGYDPLMTVMLQLGPGGPGGAPPIPNAGGDPGSVSIFTAVEEYWGLKLEPRKGPVDMLVIDHVERPREN